MKGAIWYKDGWLMPKSEAFKLHQEGKMEQLDRHMKRLTAEQHARGDTPYKPKAQ